MGLDWNPANKAKDGYEEEFKKIAKKLTKGVLWGQKKLENRFDEISVPAFESLDAPTIGKDEEALKWLRDQYDASEKEVSFEEVLNQYQGYKVFQLVLDCPGVPFYSNGPFGYVESYSFRGQFLNDCEEIIGKKLLEEAYEYHTAEELIAYGKELLNKAERYAKEHNRTIPKEPPEDDESIEALLHIVKSAGEWAVFWGEKGHGLEAYF